MAAETLFVSYPEPGQNGNPEPTNPNDGPSGSDLNFAGHVIHPEEFPNEIYDPDVYYPDPNDWRPIPIKEFPGPCPSKPEVEILYSSRDPRLGNAV